MDTYLIEYPGGRHFAATCDDDPQMYICECGMSDPGVASIAGRHCKPGAATPTLTRLPEVTISSRFRGVR